MAGKSITRAELAEAVYEQADMTKGAAADLVDQVLEAMACALECGESVKLSSFGVNRLPNLTLDQHPILTLRA